MYQPKINVKKTQKAIEIIKIQFPRLLAKNLNLTRVSAPLFLDPKTGLNDGLCGEKPVDFYAKNVKQKLEIVHSLAKWKRFALKQYCFNINEGLYADMNAIRQEENLSPLHSFYVDQWDWEKRITKNLRTEKYLKQTVFKIYQVIYELENLINKKFYVLTKKLPKEIYFIDSQELENLYPNNTPEEREILIVKQKKAVFIKKIGHKLNSGIVHSKRANDYDDWTLNGDIIVYHPILDTALELSSMGIRVDAKALIIQSQKTDQQLKNLSIFHKNLIEKTLPFSIGGGIGQSRMCMFLLEKAHIGEVQVGYWTKELIEKAKKSKIKLL